VNGSGKHQYLVVDHVAGDKNSEMKNFLQRRKRVWPFFRAGEAAHSPEGGLA
jgi:hypothetical protein